MHLCADTSDNVRVAGRTPVGAGRPAMRRSGCGQRKRGRRRPERAGEGGSGSGAVRRRRPGVVLRRCLELPARPDRGRPAVRRRRRARDPRRLPSPRRTDPAAGCRHQHQRPGRQHRRDPRLQPAPRRGGRDRPRPAPSPGPAGCRARRPARCGPAVRAHLRARSVHPQPLHARRDDRQQRLRRALGGVGQDGRQRGVARRRAGRRYPAHGGSDARRRSAAAGPRRRPDRPAVLVAARAPGQVRRPRRIVLPQADPAGLGLQPRPAPAGARASTSPTPWSAPRAPARRCSRPRSTWSRLRPPAPLPCSASPTQFTAADHVVPLLDLHPLTIESVDAGDRRHRAGAPAGQSGPRRPSGRRRLAVRRDRRRLGRRGRAPGRVRRVDHGRAGSQHGRGERPRPDAGAVADPGGRRRQHDPVAGRRRGLARAGRTPPSRRSGSAATCGSSTRCCARTAARASTTATSATAACTSGSTSTC